MADLVGTCPKDFWEEWIAEGDAAGEPPTGEIWTWYTGHRLRTHCQPGDRFYVVAHGKLRGYAPITGHEYNAFNEVSGIQRMAEAVAVTIPEAIPGFRGLRLRWWKREDEVPFPDWRNP